MNYDVVISRLNTICSNFTMDSIRELRKIFILMNRVYQKELIRTNGNKNLCATTYKNYMDCVSDTIWFNLKENLNLDDDTTKLLFELVKNTDQIKEIYILDDDVIIKYFDNTLQKEVCRSKKVTFKDIESSEFTICNMNNPNTELVVKSINNAIKSFFMGKAKDIVLINDNKVEYHIENLIIGISNSIEKILSDNSGTLISKVLVTYEDKVFYYDLKRRDDMIILSEHDNSYSVSQLLEKKANQKVKK